MSKGHMLKTSKLREVNFFVLLSYATDWLRLIRGGNLLYSKSTDLNISLIQNFLRKIQNNVWAHRQEKLEERVLIALS